MIYILPLILTSSLLKNMQTTQ